MKNNENMYPFGGISMKESEFCGIPIRISKEEKCKACYGTGIQYNAKTGLRVRCPVCGGSGKVRIPR